jgi:hypothetical protein
MQADIANNRAIARMFVSSGFVEDSPLAPLSAMASVQMSEAAKAPP